MSENKKWKKIGSSETSPIANTKRKEVKTRIPKTENIIFIGSEMFYDNFWLKMMFIAAAYAMASKMRPANKKTIAYVDNGYTHLEKLALDYLGEHENFQITKLANASDLTACINQDRDNYKLQDVAFFAHGVIGAIALNYHGRTPIDISKTALETMQTDAFAPHGRVYSYACRTGVSVEDDHQGFSTETEAMPENSLAQAIADHFDIEVHAFLRRTFYGNVLRKKAHSELIADTLKKGRKDKEGQVIQIPPDYEALPHPNLGVDWQNEPVHTLGKLMEGTNDYTLWPKHGGLELPVAADSPTGLPADMRVFTKTSHQPNDKKPNE